MTKKQIYIDYLFLDLNVCERCKKTDLALEEALNILLPIFNLLSYKCNLGKVHIATPQMAKEYSFYSSPSIMVNSIDIFGLNISENNCCGCGEICQSGTLCRTFFYQGNYYDSPPTGMIVEGVLKVVFGDFSATHQKYVLPDNLKQFFENRLKNSMNMSEENMTKKMQICDLSEPCSKGCC